MSADYKALTKRIVDEANKGNYDAVDEYYAPDFVMHQPPFPDIRGLKAYKRFAANMRASLPDLTMTIDEMVVEGNIGAMRATSRGTHTGQSKAFPFPPTGKTVAWSGCLVSRWDGGKIAETWGYWDNLGLLQQFCIIPSM
jgi:steroid delta-isomerase-like uncharacterized protein